MKKIRITALLTAVIMVISLTSCAYKFPEDYRIKDHTNGKISSEFGLYISQPNIMGSWVRTWLATINRYDGFQYYIYSDTDSWDVYLYYPDMQGEVSKLKNENVTVDYDEESGTLLVYVEYDGEHTQLPENEDEWILHLVANPKGKWPHYVRLFWNGAEVTCDDAKVYEL